MEIFDICDENGLPTGRTVERGEAHRAGILHRTAHVWLIREEAGRTQVLLQKRSRNKDSFPGLYDTSSAGHVPAGSEVLPSARRVACLEGITEPSNVGAIFRSAAALGFDAILLSPDCCDPWHRS